LPPTPPDRSFGIGQEEASGDLGDETEAMGKGCFHKHKDISFLANNLNFCQKGYNNHLSNFYSKKTHTTKSVSKQKNSQIILRVFYSNDLLIINIHPH